MPSPNVGGMLQCIPTYILRNMIKSGKHTIVICKNNKHTYRDITLEMISHTLLFINIHYYVFIILHTASTLYSKLHHKKYLIFLFHVSSSKSTTLVITFFNEIKHPIFLLVIFSIALLVVSCSMCVTTACAHIRSTLPAVTILFT